MNFIKISITDQQINDIMTSALESTGIAYWCDEAKIMGNHPPKNIYTSEALTKGYHVRIHDTEDEEWYILTLKKFLKGLELYAQNGGTLETTEIDGPAADSIVQFAIFGKQVYA